MPAIITCRALGPVELLVNGETAPPDLLWRKHLALIVYLARSPKLVRTHDHLVGLLWAEASDEKAGKSLNQAIHLVRRYAGETSINTDAGQVRLAAGVVDLDTDRFDSFTKVHQWDAAAELVGGHFLEGFGIDGASEFETWLGVERARWRERSVAALVQAGEGRGVGIRG